MPDIDPDSPVSALWPDGEGGLTGARARARLESAGVDTVAALTAMDAADVTAIPRAGKSVLAEVRRALTAAGLHLTGDPAPHPAAVRGAREQGRAEAQRAGERGTAPAETAPQATAGDFAALADAVRAELETADPDRRRRILAVPRLEDPAALAGKPWAWLPAGPAAVTELTGYSPATIRAYQARAKREHAAGTATRRTMPLPVNGKWTPADLAVWMATRNEGQAAQVKIGDAEAAEIREAVKAAREANEGTVPRGTFPELAARYGVTKRLVQAIAAGEAAEGREGFTAARERRRPALNAETAAAADEIRQRDGQVTYTALAAALGLSLQAATARAAAAGVKSDLAAEQAGDPEVAAFLAAKLAGTGRYQTVADLLAACHAAGIPAAKAQLKRLLPALRGEQSRRRHQPSGRQRARGESAHPRGWLTVPELASDWGVTTESLYYAIARGLIRTERDESGSRKRWVDPARLRPRRDNRRGPVDKDHRAALPD